MTPIGYETPMSCVTRLLKNKNTATMTAKLVTSQDLGSGSIVEFYPRGHLLTEEQADELFTNLTASTFWESHQLKIMGHSVTQPRLTAYFADSPTLQYTYSGTTMHPRSWKESPSVSHVKSLIQSFLPPTSNTSFNSCLINYYRSGQDHLSWHSDNEPLYGSNPTIASMSLGCERDFILRENPNKSTTNNKIFYSLGDVLVMKGTVQQYWQHCVPKRKKCMGPRISLTFRTILSPEH